jgi:putative transposase
MAAPLRVLIPDSYYHGMSRGNRRATVFRDDTDRRRFLGLVPELPEPRDPATWNQ